MLPRLSCHSRSLVSPSTGPPSAASISSPTSARASAWISSRSAIPSFHSAVTGPGAGSPVGRVRDHEGDAVDDEVEEQRGGGVIQHVRVIDAEHHAAASGPFGHPLPGLLQQLQVS